MINQSEVSREGELQLTFKPLIGCFQLEHSFFCVAIKIICTTNSRTTTIKISEREKKPCIEAVKKEYCLVIKSSEHHKQIAKNMKNDIIWLALAVFNCSLIYCIYFGNQAKELIKTFKKNNKPRGDSE